jgi:hypothetical protein
MAYVTNERDTEDASPVSRWQVRIYTLYRSKVLVEAHLPRVLVDDLLRRPRGIQVLRPREPISLQSLITWAL